jgi:hypothetical protein
VSSIHLELKHLLKNKYVRKLLNFVCNEGKSVIGVINYLREEIRRIFQRTEEEQEGQEVSFRSGAAAFSCHLWAGKQSKTRDRDSKEV